MHRRIWAIADTHLSFANPKPMDIFGSHWRNHAERLLHNCSRLVETDDLLLIPGDISWAMKRKDADQDLAFLAKFPGIKVLCKGNHDYWWSSDKPLNFPGLYDTPYQDAGSQVGVAGTRGWASSEGSMSPEEKASNDNIISRELRRLTKRLEAIKACEIKIVMVHYPPLEEFRQTLLNYNVSTILYGHQHLGTSEPSLPEEWFGMRCLCVAADRINFTPKLVKTLYSG